MSQADDDLSLFSVEPMGKLSFKSDLAQRTILAVVE
jgi:hypothetical protein